MAEVVLQNLLDTLTRVEKLSEKLKMQKELFKHELAERLLKIQIQDPEHNQNDKPIK